MTKLPALLISTLGHPGDLQSKTRLLVYGYKSGKIGHIFLHATDPNDARYKGHGGNMRVTEYEAMLSRIQRAKGYPLVRFVDDVVEVTVLEPQPDQKGNVGFVSDARRPIVGVWIDKKELADALKDVRRVEHALPNLVLLDAED